MILKPPKGAMLNRGHPLALGLVGCWLMNEGGGNIVNDLSGNGNTGVFVGDGVSWSAGKYGPGISLAGSDDYVSLGTNACILGSIPQFTVVCSAKVSKTGYHCLVSKGLPLAGSPYAGKGWALTIDQTNSYVYFDSYRDGIRKYQRPSVSITQNMDYQFVSVKLNNSEVDNGKIYVSGNL